MDKETYYIKLQDLVDKVKGLKSEIDKSDDEEKTKYLKLAVEQIYVDIRELMETHKKIQNTEKGT
jgi:hypothetical protein